MPSFAPQDSDNTPSQTLPLSCDMGPPTTDHHHKWLLIDLYTHVLLAGGSIHCCVNAGTRTPMASQCLRITEPAHTCVLSFPHPMEPEDLSACRSHTARQSSGGPPWQVVTRHYNSLSHLKNEWMGAKLGSSLVAPLQHSQGHSFSRRGPVLTEHTV